MNTFIVLSLLFLIGTMFMADICAVIKYSTSVRRPYLDDKIVNTRLLWKQTSEGLGPCVGVCARNSSCASVFYNKETRYCYGHSITHGTVASSAAEENNATRYYVQPFGMHLSRNMKFPTMWNVRPVKASDQPAHMRKLIRAFASRLNIL